MGDVQWQREVARDALESLSQGGFALAGSGALREHGLVTRPTEDVDLFTVMSAAERFTPAVQGMVAHLEDREYQVQVTRETDLYARVRVMGGAGEVVDVDLGVDWRSTDPVVLDIGPVLDERDSVGTKVAALYSRAEVRDLLDVDAIRQSGRYSDEELLALARAHEPNLDLHFFGQQLEMRARYVDEQSLGRYDVASEDVGPLRERAASWAAQLRSRVSGSTHAKTCVSD